VQEGLTGFLLKCFAVDQQNIFLLRHVKLTVIETGHGHRNSIVVFARLFDVVRGGWLKLVLSIRLRF
jgi:hypothetical protein